MATPKKNQITHKRRVGGRPAPKEKFPHGPDNKHEPLLVVEWADKRIVVGAGMALVLLGVVVAFGGAATIQPLAAVLLWQSPALRSVL